MRLNSIIKHLQNNGYKDIRQSIDCSACEDWAIEFKSDNFVFRLARLDHTMLMGRRSLTS